MTTKYYFEDKETRVRHDKVKAKVGEKIDNVMAILGEIVKDTKDKRSLQSHIEGCVGLIDVKTVVIGTKFSPNGAVLENCFDYDSVVEMKDWYERHRGVWSIVREDGSVIDWETLNLELLEEAKEGNDNTQNVDSDFEDEEGYRFKDTIPF